MMKIHHLNCGTMCPACERLISGYGSWTQPAQMCCHCLLIETDQSLVLVDTGIGTEDIKNPNQRLGRMFNAMMRPKFDLEETAHHQIKQLGFSPNDVTDIFPTHLDLDHAGGLSDFPQAKVHIYQPELYALKPSLKDRLRYRKVHFQHQPKWQIYDNPQQQWFGLNSFDCSEQLGFEINIVPLVGHTYGHSGIAIKQDENWLMHCGDAYFSRHQLSDDPSQMPLVMQIFERNVQTDKKQRLDSLAQLQKLKREHPEIDLFCAHDPIEFAEHTVKF